MRDSVAAKECAEAPDAVSRLALFLHAQAGAQSVRTREAIAATIANQVNGIMRARAASTPGCPDSRSLRAGLFIQCLNRLGPTAAAQPRTDEPTFASCWRIAKRAVSGALKDPTGGAVRCHELGSSPAWATGLNPSAWIGSYLFYDDFCGDEEDWKPGADMEADLQGEGLRE